MPVLETHPSKSNPTTAPPSGGPPKTSTAANAVTTPRQIMHFLYQNFSTSEIAKAVNLSESVVSDIIASEGFQLEYQKFTRAREKYAEDSEREVDEVLAREQLDSVRTLAELRDTAFNENVRRMAATDLLDRGGFGKVQRTEITHTVYISDKQLERSDETFDLVAKEGKHVFERHTRGEIPGLLEEKKPAVAAIDLIPSVKENDNAADNTNQQGAKGASNCPESSIEDSIEKSNLNSEDETSSEGGKASINT